MGRIRQRRQLTKGTSGRIIELLRRHPMTIDELASAVGITRSAIRGQLATLEQDGAIEPKGIQRGPSKPARTYGVTAEAELLLSRAYVPILTQLLHVLTGRMAHAEFDSVMREVGRSLMAGRTGPHGTVRQRTEAASELLNDLGGTTEVEKEGDHFVIRGHGCPLAAATRDHPEACNTLESLLSEFVGRPVTKCCERYDRRQCCFLVPNGD